MRPTHWVAPAAFLLFLGSSIALLAYLILTVIRFISPFL